MRPWALLLVVGCNSSTTSGTAAPSPAPTEAKPSAVPTEAKPPAAPSEAKTPAAPAEGKPAETGDADSPIRVLACSQGDKRLGTLRFPKSGTPVLTLDAQGADGDAFKANWEKLFARGKIKVKFHENRDDERPLVGLEAAPGEPGYGQVVQLKMAEEYGYGCYVDPAAK